MATIAHLGKAAIVIVGVDFKSDGRRLTVDEQQTAHAKLTDRFQAGLTELAPGGAGQWTDKISRKKVSEDVRAYVIVGKHRGELNSHAEFIATAYHQTAVFVVIGADAYELRPDTQIGS